MSLSHFTDIEGFLENENCISVRWIANNLQLNITKAEIVVKEFKESNTNVHASYLVSGLDLNGARLFLVTSEKNLTDTKTKFSKIHSTSIYSIQKDETQNFGALVATADSDQAADLLMMKHANHEDFLHNKLGKISLSNLEIKPIGQRVLSTQAIEAMAEQAVAASSSSGSGNGSVAPKKESAESHISRVFAAKSTAPVLKSKSSVQASSFFGKAATAPTSTTTTKATSVKAESKPALAKSSTVGSPAPASQASMDSSTPTASSQPMSVDDEDEDAEWDDGTGYKVDRSRLAKRVEGEEARRRVITVDDEEETDAATEEVETAEDSEAGKKRKAKAAVHVHVHGAMDSYMEDVAIAEFKSAEAGEPLPKRTKKKLVEKMYVDAKGYLVTESVMEDVTDDEGESVGHSTASSNTTKKVQSSPSDSQSQSQSQVSVTESQEEDKAGKKEKKAPAPKAAPKKAEKPAVAPQKNMMSFFGKK